MRKVEDRARFEVCQGGTDQAVAATMGAQCELAIEEFPTRLAAVVKSQWLKVDVEGSDSVLSGYMTAALSGA